MFGKKSNNKLYTENYKMENTYNVDSLVVAKLARISNEVSDIPRRETTQQKYIFEVITEGNTIKYREIFTGFLAGDDKSTRYFMLPFVVDVELFCNYFPESKGSKINKLALIWALNDINNPKQDKKLSYIKK